MERKKRSREETAKGIRLIGPVETSRTFGVTGEGVFRLVMVLENQSKLFFFLFVFFLKGGAFGRRRRREGHGGDDGTCVRD